MPRVQGLAGECGDSVFEGDGRVLGVWGLWAFSVFSALLALGLLGLLGLLAFWPSLASLAVGPGFSVLGAAWVGFV